MPVMRLNACCLLVYGILLHAGTVFAQFGPASVVTAPVEQVELREGLTFVGTALPARVSDVGSAVDGRVVDFNLLLGQRVKKDEPLAQLLTSQLEIELKAAQAGLIARKAELAELQQSRAEDIQRAEAQLAAKKAAYEYANNKLARTKKLIGTQAYTEDELEKISSDAIQAYQIFIDAQYALEIARKGGRDEAKIVAQAEVDAQVQELERIQDQLNKHTIRSPFDGYIGAKYTESGQWLTRGGLVAKVVDLDHIDIEVAVLETAVPYLSVGAQATVELTAMPEKRFVGRVAEINPQGDQRTRNFTVRIRVESNPIENDQPLIKGGMFARATLSAGKVIRGMVVPKDAVVLGVAPTPVVFVIAADPMNAQQTTVRLVPVQLGGATAGMFEVKGELKPGEPVVVKGNERLRPGAPVMVLPNK